VNAQTVRYHLQEVGERLEEELGEKRELHQFDGTGVALYLNRGISTKGLFVVLKSWTEIGVLHLNRFFLRFGAALDGIVRLKLPWPI